MPHGFLRLVCWVIVDPTGRFHGLRPVAHSPFLRLDSTNNRGGDTGPGPHPLALLGCRFPLGPAQRKYQSTPTTSSEQVRFLASYGRDAASSDNHRSAFI